MTGGQATNSGINYQQRVSAFFLICMLADFDISDHIKVSRDSLKIKKVFFETETPIDDLVVECEPYNKLFLQIKRSLSLSTQKESDFTKTIHQFVKEFSRRPYAPANYGIITSSKSSSKITYDLKKILTSITLNDSSFEQNPLNDSEKDTLQKFKDTFFELFKSETGNTPSELQFYQFSQKCFIGMLDIESGQSIELASYMLLKSQGFLNPELVWAVLIKDSLNYASQRLSIQQESLLRNLDRYLEKKTVEQQITDDSFFEPNVISEGEYSAGKDVLLIESFIEGLDYLVVDLLRFGEGCKRRCVYYSNKIKILSNEEWTVVQRFATQYGLDRFIEENKERLSKKKIAIMPINGIEDVEIDECANLHKAHLDYLLKQNKTVLKCLHCGKGITTNKCLIVEIDDRDSKEAVGLVHEICLRPIDRIMGKPFWEEKKLSKHLEHFDFKTWTKLMINGQGLMNALKESPNILQGGATVIAWSSDEEYDREYSYCIRFVLEDETFVYDYNRSKIVRLNRIDAENRLQFFEEGISKMKKEGNPRCFTSIKKMSGSYSELVKVKASDEKILEVIKVEIVRYSDRIAKMFDNDIEYYAPMCLIRDQEYELILNLGNIVPLISNPLNIDNLIDNWTKLGLEFEPVDLKIIKTDKDFDNNMRMIFSDGMVPIIDPEFDKKGNLVNGYPIQVFEEIIENRKGIDDV